MTLSVFSLNKSTTLPPHFFSWNELKADLSQVSWTPTYTYNKIRRKINVNIELTSVAIKILGERESVSVFQSIFSQIRYDHIHFEEINPIVKN